MGRVLVALAAVALLSACGGSSVSVDTDFDPVASPKAVTYRTWNWLRAPGSPARADSAVQAVVERAVETRLSAMGYQKSDTNPEFRVGWHAALTESLDVTTLNTFYGYAWGRWFPGGGVVYSRGFRTQYEPGSLIIDVADSRVSELIWRGIGREVFRANDKEGDRERVVAEAVAKMFATFPPRQ